MLWMNPSYVSANGRYIITSQLFQSRTMFNAAEDSPYKVDYSVHPWIVAAGVPHNTDWIPNPDLIQVFDG